MRPVRAVIRALALQQMDQGPSTDQAGVAVGISAKAPWQIGKQYLEGGLQPAIYGTPRPGGSGGWAPNKGPHLRRGVRASARRARSVCGAADRRGDGEAHTGQACKAGDGPHPVSGDDLKPWLKNVGCGEVG